MFSKLTSRKKRGVWTPATVAASIGAHVLLLGGVVYAGGLTPPQQGVIEFPLPDYVPPQEPIPLQPPQPKPPAPTEPQDAPRPVPGQTVVLTPPTTIPPLLPPVDSSAPVITKDDVTGDGPLGDVKGPPPADPAPPTGNATGDPAETVYAPTAVDERPALRNGREMERVLQRLYPRLLQEAGVSGQTVLSFVIDEAGNVEAGSVVVVSSTHEEFKAASREAAERFRFRPARVSGRPVKVMISMPIAWTIQK